MLQAGEEYARRAEAREEAKFAAQKEKVATESTSGGKETKKDQ